MRPSIGEQGAVRLIPPSMSVVVTAVRLLIALVNVGKMFTMAKHSKQVMMCLCEGLEVARYDLSLTSAVWKPSLHPALQEVKSSCPFQFPYSSQRCKVTLSPTVADLLACTSRKKNLQVPRASRSEGAAVSSLARKAAHASAAWAVEIKDSIPCRLVLKILHFIHSHSGLNPSAV